MAVSPPASSRRRAGLDEEFSSGSKYTLMVLPTFPAVVLWELCKGLQESTSWGGTGTGDHKTASRVGGTREGDQQRPLYSFLLPHHSLLASSPILSTSQR